MKKSVVLAYKAVEDKDIAPISQSADPMNSGRLPVGKLLTAEPKMRYVPPTGTITKPWQAVILTEGDNAYPVSPRVLLGLGFKEGKFVQLSERKFPKKPLIDIIKTSPKFKVVEYQEVEQDDFTTKEIVARSFPLITIEKGGDE